MLRRPLTRIELKPEDKEEVRAPNPPPPREPSPRAPPTIPPATRDDRSRKRLERDLTALFPTPIPGTNAVRGGPQGSHSQTPGGPRAVHHG